MSVDDILALSMAATVVLLAVALVIAMWRMRS